MLKTLEDNHSRLRNTNHAASAKDLLTECQSLAIQAGEYIESIEGEGTGTVALLEEYCDLVFQAYEDNSGANYSRKLQSQAIKIINSVRSELKPNKIEVVFFPYQLSMFDSLQSVYQAAKEDPQCDAYVIPIPWYERLPDGELGKMHYDGDQYPKNIPVTNWRDYGVAERHPDVIFIHAPFDEGGHVTFLHPDFHSKRLRELTDLLCYIPYFVYVDTDVEKHVAYEACAYAHKVFLQSEEVRDNYVRIFREKFGDKYGKPKDKFVALGSPKFDAVFNAKREDFEVPEEWSKLINGKKTILYNTSVDAAINDGEGNLKKIQFVLDSFRERDDIILWWRPHPLLEATYQTKQPDLLSRLRQIIDDYKKEGWGIYDDTPDLHRAIAWTDAYYGDGGSMVALYGATGKPLMINNHEMLSNEASYLPYSFCISNNTMWFTIYRFNALFKMKETDCSVEYVGTFPNEDSYLEKDSLALFNNPVELNGVVYFPPFMAKEVAAYSFQTNAFTKYSYERTIAGEVVERSFSGATAYNNQIFFTPYQYPAIMRLSIDTNEITYHADWIERIKKLSSTAKDAFFLRPLTVGDTIWLACCRANAVVEFNMETCLAIVHEVGQADYRYNGICYDGEDFWLSPRQNTATPLVKWNPSIGIIKEFFEIYPEDEAKHNYFPNLYCNGYIWLLPIYAKNAFKIDIQTYEIIIAEEFKNKLYETKKTQRPPALPQVLEDSIYAFDSADGKIISYNCKTKKRKEMELHITKQTSKKLDALLPVPIVSDGKKTGSVSDCCCYENNSYRLDWFINYSIMEHETERSIRNSEQRTTISQLNKAHSGGVAGQVIFDYVKNGRSLSNERERL